MLVQQSVSVCLLPRPTHQRSRSNLRPAAACSPLRFGFRGQCFGVQGVGFRGQCFGVLGLGFRGQCFGVQGLGFRGPCFGVQGLGFRGQCFGV